MFKKRMKKVFCIYILANKSNGTLYIGITNNLLRRVRLVIQREKQLKWWKRSWKIKLIEDFNPIGETYIMKLEERMIYLMDTMMN